MKVLHTTVMSKPAIGILRQLEGESGAADSLGLQWTTKFFSDQPFDSSVAELSPASAANRLKFKIAYYRWLIRTSKDYDVLVLRYCSHDVLQMLFLLRCKLPVYVVHHTLEVPELHSSSDRLSSVKILIEKIVGSISLSLVDGIIAVTPEILQYESSRRLLKRKIETYVHPNGIEFSKRDSVDISLPDEAEQVIEDKLEMEIPTLLFVSSFFGAWQGLDELASNATSYDGEFICHVVGDLSETQKEFLSADSRFVMHGRLERDAIRSLIKQSDIGLSALTMSKKKMTQACTLKVREYLKDGLAVYAGHQDIFPEDFKYFRNGEISMEDIIAYALDHKANDRKLVSDTARPYIEKKQLLSNLHDFLLQNYKAGRGR